MKQIQHIATFFLLAIISGYAQQEKRDFSLDEAVEYALEYGYTATNAQRDVIVAAKQKWEATSRWLPQIDGVIDYQNQLKQPVSMIPGEFFGEDPGTFVPVIFAVPQTMTATATLNQTIFDGTVLVGLQAARTFEEYTQNTHEKSRADIRKDVIAAYGNVLLTQQNIDILEHNRGMLDKNLTESRAMYGAGLAEEEDVEQLQITLSNMDIQLENARRLQALSGQMLNLVLGIDIDEPVTLTDTLEGLITQNTQLGILSEELVLENNVDYRLAENLVEQRRLEHKLERSKALPTLTGFVNYNTQAFDNDFVFLDSDTPWFQFSILGVSLRWNLFTSFGRDAAVKRTAIAYDQAKTDLDAAGQQISLEAETARSDYQFAIDNYENATENLRLAERIENKNQVKFFEGISSSFDLRQAQLQLYTAQQEYLQSMLNVINSKAELERVLNR